VEEGVVLIKANKKRPLVCFILVSTVLSFFALALANAGPSYWQGYPSSEILLVHENCPIEVVSETLIFDLTDSESFSYSLGGKVTATYRMLNPTQELQRVQMAFPIVSSIRELSPEDILIKAGGKEIPYKVYFGNELVNRDPRQEEVSFDFADILSTVSDGIYLSGNFKAHDIGKLYLIKVSPTTDQPINYAVEFSLDDEKTKVINKGFNRYEWGEKRVRTAARCYNPEVLEIFVLGEDIDFDFQVYSDGELKQKTDLYECQITAESMELKSYLMDFIKNEIPADIPEISDVQWYNMYAKALDRSLSQNLGFVALEDVLNASHRERIIVLIFELDFPPGSERELKVSYFTTGTMDKTQTLNPLYTFYYLLNPAKNWNSFKNLSIEIITPKKAPFIVESSIAFEKKRENLYSAYLEELPLEDLSFTLYYKEKITWKDKIQTWVYKLQYLLYFGIPGGIAVISVVLIAIIIKFIKH